MGAWPRPPRNVDTERGPMDAPGRGGAARALGSSSRAVADPGLGSAARPTRPGPGPRPECPPSPLQPRPPAGHGPSPVPQRRPGPRGRSRPEPGRAVLASGGPGPARSAGVGIGAGARVAAESPQEQPGWRRSWLLPPSQACPPALSFWGPQRQPSVQPWRVPTEPGLEPWKEPLVQPPGSCCSSGDWAWDLASDQSSSPATPSPPLPPEAVHFLFGEPALRKRKGPAQVLFQCLWKRCGKVLNSASGMHRHIRLAHLGRQAELEQSDGEEDFYYTELDMSMDALAEGLSSLTPTSPAATAPPAFPLLELPEPTALPSLPALSSGSTTEVFHRDHAYQGCPAPTSLQLLPAVRACAPALPSKCGTNTRKPRGDAKKCRKVYGVERRDLWCTACRWKKACQRFLD
ncbi:SLC2A4 regulator isoform X4 [Erinaceus europaeus]|uniref:SLC2A4 regulator isoform X4 n=1 Tax=Erinaceus europaeus TaxID=9365 RepID=A0ABM3VTH8_ERIEU|nr:SLC2A4 regulator isoform X4 [Erinaceus europaeus]